MSVRGRHSSPRLSTSLGTSLPIMGDREGDRNTLQGEGRDEEEDTYARTYTCVQKYVGTRVPEASKLLFKRRTHVSALVGRPHVDQRSKQRSPPVSRTSMPTCRHALALHRHVHAGTDARIERPVSIASPGEPRKYEGSTVWSSRGSGRRKANGQTERRSAPVRKSRPLPITASLSLSV